MKDKSKIKEHTYYVKGMHCASCEILIEKKLLDIERIKFVEASIGRGEVSIEYKGEEPAAESLNKIFEKENYIFSNQAEIKNNFKQKEFFITLSIGLSIIIVFIGLNKFGLSGLINVNSKSSLPMFLLFGLIAGVSSCAALVGGLILSMSKQWGELYSKENSFLQKLQPHLMFNAGRMISYIILGAVLGAIGSKLQISLKFTSLLVIGISIMMFFLSIQMLGVKYFHKFQFTLPKSATRYIADESNFKGRYMPFIMGALTFFLPCGFTITAQGLSLLSGSPIQGALIMFFFALGTAPMLLFIGISSVKLLSKPNIAYRFSKVAGFLVLFFALFNINNQLNVLGYTSLNDLSLNKEQVKVSTVDKDLALVVDGKQLIKMDASASRYKPNYFKVRAGVPVRWEITDKGTSGCTNAIISKGLFSDQISLTPGQVAVKEFTPQSPGKYKFSCWMGMVSGTIEVVSGSGASSDVSASSASSGTSSNNNSTIPSGASACGCGCGGK